MIRKGDDLALNDGGEPVVAVRGVEVVVEPRRCRAILSATPAEWTPRTIGSVVVVAHLFEIEIRCCLCTSANGSARRRTAVARRQSGSEVSNGLRGGRTRPGPR